MIYSVKDLPEFLTEITSVNTTALVLMTLTFSTGIRIKSSNNPVWGLSIYALT